MKLENLNTIKAFKIQKIKPMLRNKLKQIVYNKKIL